MLTRLHIENVAVIEKADIDFGSGFIVLTGETGAGKSILIDSINVLLGNRASKDIVRSGCSKAVVNASFSVNISDAELLGICLDAGVEPDGDILILQREITSDGRSYARVNGRQVTASVLKKISSLLIGIHGQQDNASLLDPSKHLSYLDSFAANRDIYEKYSAAYSKTVAVRRKIKLLSGSDADKAKRAELLRYQIDEITLADISEGEEDALESRRKTLVNAEKISETLGLIREYICGGQNSAEDSVSSAVKYIRRIGSFSEELNSLASMLEDTLESISDISENIRDLIEGLDFSADELDKTEERLRVIFDLKNKYGGTAEKINEYRDSAEKELREIEFSGELLEQLETEFEKCTEELAVCAGELSRSRTAAAAKLEKAVISELAFLDMPDVRFKVSVVSGAAGASGCDTVEFLLSANVGEDLKPLNRIASGGELSRIMLSLKNVLADADKIETSVFDEIDTGVSGSAAGKIAIKLKQISLNRQVIAVTHLAPLAAYADQHLLIEKHNDGVRTYTEIRELGREGRISELARILNGVNITDSVIAAASEMLDSAAGQI